MTAELPLCERCGSDEGVHEIDTPDGRQWLCPLHASRFWQKHPQVDAERVQPGLNGRCANCGTPGDDDGEPWFCDDCGTSDRLDAWFKGLGRSENAGQSSWEPVALDPILSGEQTDPPPSILVRTDGLALLYPGRVHALFGEPEACKGWIALTASHEVIQAGGRVLYVDFEDGAASVVGRLRDLGVEDDAIRARFVYVRPDEPITTHGREAIDKAGQGVNLAVLDGVTEAMTLHGLDLASNGDVATWQSLLPRPLAQAGAAVLELDHVVKDRENRGRYAIGAQHKLAGVDVAYSVKVAEPFGRGRTGRVTITVTKDRPGFVRAYADEGRAAEVQLTSHDDGMIAIELHSTGEQGAFRPTTLMERVSRVVEDEPGIGTNSIRRTVKGRAKFVQDALSRLIDEGYVDRRQDVEGKPVRHYSIRPFRADTDDRVPPRPDRVPETVGGNRVPASPPYRGRGPGRGAAEPVTNGHRVPLAEDALAVELDRAERLAHDHADIADP